ncbi:MAG: hypothetical protein QY323_05325 [Patescibacteria group bacterium]|nr:MAG: hypothetical protein QY323_05325 [Patescibacteria group bacterium]
MPFLIRWLAILVITLAFVVLLIALAAFWKERSEKKRAALVRADEQRNRLAYDRLLAEMMAYASEPGTVFHEEAFADFMCMRTVADRFGKRCYVERQRKFDQALHRTLCLFENGDWIPSKSVVVDIPATQVDWAAYHRNVRDIREHGAKFSFLDESGLHRQVRVRCEPAEPRV